MLIRGRDGRNHGKGLAIAALIISVLSLVGVGIGGYYAYDYAKDFKDVGTSTPATASPPRASPTSPRGVTQIRSVGCSDKHDGEVLSTGTLTADQAASYGETSPVAICTPSVTEAGSIDLLADPELVLIALTEDRRRPPATSGVRDRERGRVEADLQLGS